MIDAQKMEMERARNEMQAKDEQINLVFISLIFTLLGFAGLVYAYLKRLLQIRYFLGIPTILKHLLEFTPVVVWTVGGTPLFKTLYVHVVA